VTLCDGFDMHQEYCLCGNINGSKYNTNFDFFIFSNIKFFLLLLIILSQPTLVQSSNLNFLSFNAGKCIMQSLHGQKNQKIESSVLQ